jgi:hypothetical protein
MHSALHVNITNYLGAIVATDELVRTLSFTPSANLDSFEPETAHHEATCAKF